jgi:hypothetical protein
MFEKFRRSWAMAVASWGVLKQHPRLAILPAMSAAALLAAFGVFVAAVTIEAGGFEQAGRLVRGLDRYWDEHAPAAIVALMAVGWVLTVVAIYFNSALAFCAMRCFAGRQPSIREGLVAAVARLPQIAGWAFVAAVVGTLLGMLENMLKDRLGFLGNLVGGLFNIGWAAVTYFVLPVLVVEGLGPIASVKRSSALLRQTWGETLGGNVGLAGLSVVVMLPAIMMIVIGVAITSATGIGSVAAILFVAAIVYIAVGSVIFSTLGAILQTGLYVYATTGRAPFDEAVVRAAFQRKAL